MVLAICVVGAVIVTALIGRYARPLGTSLGLLDFPDDPGGRKLHAQVTPLVGGVAVAGVTLAAILATLAAGDLTGAVERDLAWLAGAIAAMFVIGAADDRFELSVRIRLGLATLLLLLTVWAAPDFGVIFVRFGHDPVLRMLGPWSTGFTLVCLVGLLNAVNMADGKNGIVISLALVWSTALLLRLPPTMVPVMAAAAASLAVLLGFNMRGRLFLGDGGTYALSALFGLLAIYAYNHAFATIGAEDIALLFAVPVVDTLRLVVVRLMQRRSPFAGGRDHFHHYLYARVGWPRGLYIYVAIVAVPNAAAVVLPGTGLVWLAATVLAYSAALTFVQRPAAA